MDTNVEAQYDHDSLDFGDKIDLLEAEQATPIPESQCRPSKLQNENLDLHFLSSLGSQAPDAMAQTTFNKDELLQSFSPAHHSMVRSNEVEKEFPTALLDMKPIPRPRHDAENKVLLLRNRDIQFSRTQKLDVRHAS